MPLNLRTYDCPKYSWYCLPMLECKYQFEKYGWLDRWCLWISNHWRSQGLQDVNIRLSFLPKEKWLKTFFQSSTVSQPDCTDSESIHLKSQKIRVYPEKSLHLLWKKWLAASRYCFNQAIAYQRKHSFISKYDLRKVILKVGGMAIRPYQIGLKNHLIILKSTQ